MNMIRQLARKWISVHTRQMVFSGATWHIRHLRRSVKTFVLEFGPFNSVLDVGCGELPFRSLFGVDTQYTGIDGRERIEFGRGYVNTTIIPFDQEYWVSGRLPFESGSMDAIICTQVLEHVWLDSKLVAECFRVLKAGGVMFCTVPCAFPNHEQPNDWRRYTVYGIARLGLDLGFIPVRVESWGGVYGIILTYVGCLCVETHARLGVPFVSTLLIWLVLLSTVLLGLLFDGNRASSACVGASVVWRKPVSLSAD